MYQLEVVEILCQGAEWSLGSTVGPERHQYTQRGGGALDLHHVLVQHAQANFRADKWAHGCMQSIKT